MRIKVQRRQFCSSRTDPAAEFVQNGWEEYSESSCLLSFHEPAYRAITVDGVDTSRISSTKGPYVDCSMPLFTSEAVEGIRLGQ